ncbi:hypothetical protein E4U57_004854 [Claviceps arundinis]|uniref:Uncharacterized protein n=1 Tax=Claviceps arundinis TaxID=1623583 RepID=A0ABQ7PIS7_9HYPO|nr:hypothetical protein E4U57_004854 [Claviceps arundinis]
MRFYLVLSALAGLALADLNQKANEMRDVQDAVTTRATLCSSRDRQAGGMRRPPGPATRTTSAPTRLYGRRDIRQEPVHEQHALPDYEVQVSGRRGLIWQLGHRTEKLGERSYHSGRDKPVVALVQLVEDGTETVYEPRDDIDARSYLSSAE